MQSMKRLVWGLILWTGLALIPLLEAQQQGDFAKLMRRGQKSSQQAERARYEDPYLESRDLTPEDLSLVSHIWEHFDRLSKQLERGV